MCEDITNSNVSDELKNFTLSEWLKYLAFDMDKNGFPSLTEKNVALINFIIRHDSNYRPLDENDNDSISQTIKKYGKTRDETQILSIVKVIDKSNSTRQASLGRGHKVADTIEKKDGREKTARIISEIENFYQRLNERDLSLVSFIAEKAIDTRYTLSFASKFCTYMARALFSGKEADNYCIFDKVICDILPYYAWVYLGEKYTRPLRPKSKKGNANQKDSTVQTKIISTIKEEFGAKER